MMRLPSKVHKGKMRRVNSFNSVTVDLMLGLGVHKEHEVIIEGIDASAIPTKLHDAAMHCLVLLLGGKKVFVQVDADNDEASKPVLGRIYYDGATYNNPEGLMHPPWAEHPLLEVGAFFQSLKAHKYSVAYVKKVVNGGSKVSA